VQTEDNGARYAVVTDVFADGGRVVASRTTSYEEQRSHEDLDEHVRALMQKQHKELLLAIRNGSFDGQ